MSDAIRLIVGEDGPARIAVGEADPVARREIAELQEDVEAIQEDVADIEERLDDAVQPDGTYPALTSGAALSLTSPTAAESTWAQRVTDAVDGVAVVDGILGNTIVQDGELLSVNLTGVESVGFNLLPSGVRKENTAASYVFNESDAVCLVAGQSYRYGFETPSAVSWRIAFKLFDAAGAEITGDFIDAPITVEDLPSYGFYYNRTNKAYKEGGDHHNSSMVFTATRKCYIVPFSAITLTNPCINISNPTLNGTYKPYATYQRTIPAATYFPNGMRSAGTVYDELTSDAAITRVGEVDLGTLTWAAATDSVGQYFYAVFTGVKPPASSSTPAKAVCSKYPVSSANNVQNGTFAIPTSANRIFVRDTTYTDAAEFTSAMSGVVLYYALATPTTTPIDPPLTLTYRVERGGTESVMHANPTSAPTWRTRYPFDLAGTVMANIAPVEQAVATANHAIGDLLCVGWQLYRATRAIAIGEAITQGTNVTPTTVAAEIAAIQ